MNYFLVSYHLIRFGYFLGLEKSILVPQLVVPYLGFLSDSVAQMFHMLPDKKARFLQLVRKILDGLTVTVQTLQHLVGKCNSFALAVHSGYEWHDLVGFAYASTNSGVWSFEEGD